jgi:Zn finger protein HypA/HybF involved in hydrogenase expression
VHELAQIPPLLRKIHELKSSESTGTVTRSTLCISQFFPMSAEVLKVHLIEAIQGTDLENIEWVIKESAGPDGPGPAEILLEEVDFTE